MTGEESPEPEPEADPTVGKAGRNEERKITAALANNGSLALLLAGLLQPVLSLIRGERPLTLVELVTYAILTALGYGFHLVARSLARKLED